MTDPRDIAIEVLAEALLNVLGGGEVSTLEEGSVGMERVPSLLLDANPRFASMLLTGAAVEMLPQVLTLRALEAKS